MAVDYKYTSIKCNCHSTVQNNNLFTVVCTEHCKGKLDRFEMNYDYYYYSLFTSKVNPFSLEYDTGSVYIYTLYSNRQNIA
jgi:hypothetical protein